MRSRRPLIALLAAVALTVALRADPLATAEHRFRQYLPVAQPGPVQVALPVETLDAARPDLVDIRLADPAGNEVPFAIERAEPATWQLRQPESQTDTVEDQAMVFVLKTGTGDSISGLEVDAGQKSFLTRAMVEASDDGRNWRALGRNLPLYDRGGQLRALRLGFPTGSYPYLRLTLDRLGDQHVVLRRISLLTQPVHVEQLESVAIRAIAREESASETRLTLALPGANLQIATLQVATPEPVFSRPVRLVYRAFEGDSIREVIVAQRTIARPASSEPPNAGSLAISVEKVVPSRELILAVDNGDSPPLALPAISARRRPVSVVFYATAAGLHTLYVGSQKATSPRYDVGALAAELQPARLAPGPLRPNPGFFPGEPLPEIPSLGAPLDVAPWGWRKIVQISAAGVQQLELDPAVLSRARHDLADIRLVSDGRQVPYVVEATSLTRSFAITAVSDPDTKRPRISRWRLALPQPRLPLTRITAVVSSPLFQRTVQLYEDIEDDRGYTSRRFLGEAGWSRAPGQRTEAFALNLVSTPESDTLWLETENGDNPPVALGSVTASYAVTRLLFKAAGDTPLFLYYGAAQAAAPQYDLSLVGSQLLAADKSAAGLGPEETLKAQSLAGTVALAGRGGILFWGMLGLVVVVLLAVIARLLPKTPPPTQQK